jgi:hypothetical protein
MVQKKSLISKGTTTKANATNSKPTPAVKPSVLARVAAAQKMAVKTPFN